MFPRPILLALGALAILLTANAAGICDSSRNDFPPVRLAALATADPAKSANRAVKEVVLDETFSVKEGDRLDINVVHSDVSIEAGPDGEAAVRIVVSGNRGREFYEHLNFTVEKRGDAVHVSTDPRGRWNRGGGDVHVFVAVPESFDADVETAHGDVDIDRMSGALSYSIAHGDFAARSLTGSSLRLQTAHGDLDIAEAASGKIQIHAAHGDIAIESLTSSEFETEVQHGDIDISRAEGFARVSSTHGDVAIGFLKLNGGTFATSHGDIDLAAPAGVAIDVDLSGDDVEIGSGHSFEGTLRDKRAEGRINGGGPRVDVRASHGEISFRAI